MTSYELLTDEAHSNDLIVAEYLEVTEAFLLEALQRYRSKYGICAVIDRFVIYFEPRLAVLEII